MQIQWVKGAIGCLWHDTKSDNMENLITCRINMMVADLSKAIHFYCDILGLDLIARYGDHYAEVQGPDLMIGLHPTMDDIEPGNSLSIGFGVTNFDETIDRLGSRGILFRVQNDGGIRLAHFKDVDKNSLFLAERKE